MQNQQPKVEDLAFAPSFSVYSSDTITSRAVAKAIREEEAARFHQNDAEEFEFVLVSSDEEGSEKEIESRGCMVSKHGREIKGPLGKLFIEEPEDFFSYSSSEADEFKGRASGTYCEWRPKANRGSSPLINKRKKNSSTGSGSKRWIFRFLIGKEPMMLSTPKKVQKGNFGEVSKVGGPWKVHEKFYVQKNTENEGGKRKTYLPYKTDLVGLFANANGMKKLLAI